MSKARILANLISDNAELADGQISVAEVVGAAPTASPTFTGNIAVTGNVDGRDVAADGTKLDGIEASADVTDTVNVVAALTAGSNITIASDGTIAGAAQYTDTDVASHLAGNSLTVGGLTTTADVSFGDNDKAVFGAGSDLQIYHSGSVSLIDDVGTGNLILKTNGTKISLQNDNGGSPHDMVTALTSGAVQLRHSSDIKLATTSTGIDVTGTVNADAFTGTSGTFSGTVDVNQLQLRDTGDYITFYGGDQLSHSISSRNNLGAAADDLRINSYGALYVNLDSNDNQTNTANFVIGNHGGIDGTMSSLFTVSGETGNVSLTGELDMNNNDIVGVNNIYHEADSNSYMGFHSPDMWRVVTGGTERLTVNNSSIIMASTLAMNAHNIDMNNNDIVGVDKIVHEGDSDTWIRFHNSNQFQIVTGGTERLEVNNTRTQIDNLEVTGTATFNGTVVGAGGLQFISTIDIANDTTAEFTGFDASLYDSYEFTLSNVSSSVDNGFLALRTSTDGGSTYDSGSSHYAYIINYARPTGTDLATGDNSGGYIILAGNGLGKASGEEGASGVVEIFGPHLARRTTVVFRTCNKNSSGALTNSDGGGQRHSSADVNAVQFFLTNATMTSGTITMYGKVNS